MLNLKLIDAAIASYGDGLEREDADRLALFRTFWGLQAEAMAAAPAGDAALAPSQLASAVRERRPVFSVAPVSIDGDALASLAEALGCAAVESGAFPPEVTAAFERVKWDRVLKASKPERAGLDPAGWLEYLVDVLVDDGMEPVAARLAALLASMALRAQLEKPAASVVKACKKEGIELSSSLRCPVCGTAPMMAHVGSASASAEHGRVLVCGQCGTAWDFERVRCARCGQRDQTKLHFFNVEGDDAHRIASCDECGGYIRTLYSESALAPCSYEVEDVLMARLDAIALDPQVASGGREATPDEEA